jgi:anti-anti-sigma factor
MAHEDTQLDLNYEDDVVCARIRKRRIDETELQSIGDDLIGLVEKQGCRKLILSLGPEAIECLYSVFIAKLVGLHRRVEERGGAMILCDVAPEVMAIFTACRLQDFFEFLPDREAALAAMKTKSCGKAQG